MVSKFQRSSAVSSHDLQAFLEDTLPTSFTFPYFQYMIVTLKIDQA